MIGYTELAQACFDNDSLTDEGQFSEVFKRQDTTLDDVRQVAEQRCMKFLIGMRSPEEAQRVSSQAYARKYTVEMLTNKEEAQLPTLMSVWLDACLAGMRAKDNTEN